MIIAFWFMTFLAFAMSCIAVWWSVQAYTYFRRSEMAWTRAEAHWKRAERTWRELKNDEGYQVIPNRHRKEES